MIGQTISHYRILGKLGSGGMGEVYLAEDERLGRKLAIKILLEQFTQEPDRVRRFEQEARAASALNHPNIITIYEIGSVNSVTGPLHFIATEFVEGETLRSRLNALPSERKIEMVEAIEIAIQCCNALEAAHKSGIIHRDIKPENIMMRPDGYVKILDFGLAKLTEQSSEGSAGGLQALTKSLFETQPGMVLGTVAYMSPEQARGQRVDGRSDIFSLGVTLYEMVSGHRPFGGATISDTIAELLLSEPKPLSQHLPNVPVELESVVARMLAKDREARYWSAQEVLTDLKRAKSRCELASDIGATAPMDHSACYDTNIAMLSEFQTPSPISREIKTPSQAGQELKIPSQARQELQAPSQFDQELKTPSHAGFETDIIPINARPDWQSARQMQYSSGPITAPQFRPRRSRLRRLFLPALACLAILLATSIGLMYYSNRAAKIDSIAVLPFTVANKADGGGADADYLSEGIAETIINTLSQWPELSVSSRNSVIRYKGRDVDARAIGRELEVKAVLFGKIRRVGKDLTINAELVDASNGRQIWGDNFNLKTTDLLAVPDRITRNITGRLQLRLGDAQSLFAGVGTSDSEAYDLFLKGRYFWNQGTREAMAKADEYFEKAAGKDPSYALAVAGCAACHAAGSDGKKPQESMEKAKKVATIALKTDDTLVDARLTLAQVNFRYDWDFGSAERQFKRAIQLNPKNASAHHSYAEFLALMGRHKEAADELNRARRLDPRSLQINTAFGTLAYYSRDYQEAIRQLKKTLEIDDALPLVHTRLGLAYEQQGDIQDAVLSFLRASSLTPAGKEKTATLRKAFSGQGRDAFWREYLSQLTRESKERYIPQTAIAAVQTRLGRNDQALDTLAKAIEEKDVGLVELKVEPVFEPLRSNSKFSELLRRVGLPQ
jgi:serine/threonine protein kinase/TolB-like protein/Tfp pilus assembly protein PilF